MGALCWRPLGIVALVSLLAGCLPDVADEGAGGPSYPPDTWVTLTSAPNVTDAGCAAAIGNNIYVFSAGITQIYNVISDSWSTGTTMSQDRADFTCAAQGGSIYVFNGLSHLGGDPTITLRYNPGGNTWTTRQTATDRYASGAATVGSNVYIFGGFASGQLSLLERYSPTGNSFTTLASFGTPLSDIQGASDGTAGFWTFGGKDSGGGANGIVQYYDVTTNGWGGGASMLTPRYGNVTARVNGLYYVIGGYTSAPVATNEVYDPGVNSWTALTPMPTARWKPHVAVVHGVIYVIGGIGGVGGEVEAYYP